MKVYATGQIRAVIYAIGVVQVLVYFGLRWFGTSTKKSKSWPPVINMCPDYLTYVPALPGCVDLLGVSSNGNLVVSMPSDVPALQLTNTQKVFEYTSADIKSAQDASDLQEICDRCQSAGVTWEGVYDGDTCVGISKIASTIAAKESCVASL